MAVQTLLAGAPLLLRLLNGAIYPARPLKEVPPLFGGIDFLKTSAL